MMKMARYVAAGFVLTFVQPVHAACFDNPMWSGGALTPEFIDDLKETPQTATWITHLRIVGTYLGQTSVARKQTRDAFLELSGAEGELTLPEQIAGIDLEAASEEQKSLLARLYWQHGCAEDATAVLAQITDPAPDMVFMPLAFDNLADYAATLRRLGYDDIEDPMAPPDRRQVLMALLARPGQAEDTLARAQFLTERGMSDRQAARPPELIGAEFVLAVMRDRILPDLPDPRSEPDEAFVARATATSYLLALGQCAQVGPQATELLSWDLPPETTSPYRIELESLMLRCATLGARG